MKSETIYFPSGTRIMVDSLDDGRYHPANLTGTVDFTDSGGRLHIMRDNGQTLTVIPSKDRFHVMPSQQPNKRNNEVRGI